MKVKAIRPGLYNHKLRKEGEIFDLEPMDGLDSNRKKKHWNPEDLFSAKWMEKMDGVCVKKKKVSEPIDLSVDPEEVI